MPEFDLKNCSYFKLFGECAYEPLMPSNWPKTCDQCQFFKVRKQIVEEKDAPTIKETDTIYGYPAKDLVIFAEMCRRHDITEDMLRDYVLNVSQGYTQGWEEQNREAKEQLQKMIDSFASHAVVFSVPEIKRPETNEPCDHFLIPKINDEDHTLDFKIGGD